MDSKPRNSRVYPVLFFGSLDYAWITPENLEPYEENLAKYGSKAKNRKDPSFADALKQAQDPKLAEEIIQRSLTAADDDDDEDETSEEEQKNGNGDVEMKHEESESGHEVQPQAGRRNRSSNGRPRKATAGSKRMSMSSNSSNDDTAAVETSPKRSRTAADEKHASKSGSPEPAPQESDDGRPAAKESPRSVTPSTRRSPEQTSDKSPPKDDAKPSRSTKSHQHVKNGGKRYQLLMQLRHKLQKTVIKGPIPDDLAPVGDVLRKLEDFDMTLELIQMTKLGKVMRIIAESDRLPEAHNDVFDIKGRAARLAEKWRQLILRLREGSAEPAAPDSPLAKSPEADSRQGENRSGGNASNGAASALTESTSVSTVLTNTAVDYSTEPSADAAPASAFASAAPNEAT
ncbi:hypothetical protein LPJ78_000677 [Coemansia sp. RSA 989]|nr:hypothetical protein LPJ68_000348 [Coemansia sp. RSA 1086]KAJ1752672.1 hypothetical protein LPJ79_001058 [Coemansia sp. RSA 1821]KAJ1867805.1 hypothetical protein LPJ78_000677 [Coemansia sp. RSA 989]KAJ2633706.1 hypothetical protein H4R22_000246 [Coemansia sp. RSA 1290]